MNQVENQGMLNEIAQNNSEAQIIDNQIHTVQVGVQVHAPIDQALNSQHAIQTPGSVTPNVNSIEDLGNLPRESSGSSSSRPCEVVQNAVDIREKFSAESSPLNQPGTSASLTSERYNLNDDATLEEDKIESQRLLLRGSSCIPMLIDSRINFPVSYSDNDGDSVTDVDRESEKLKTYHTL